MRLAPATCRSQVMSPDFVIHLFELTSFGNRLVSWVQGKPCLATLAETALAAHLATLLINQRTGAVRTQAPT